MVPGSVTGASSGSVAVTGDVIRTHVGLYRPERLNYVDGHGAVRRLDGAHPEGTLIADHYCRRGRRGHLRWRGNEYLFNVTASKHHILEGRRSGHRRRDPRGPEGVDGRSRLTVQNCRFETLGSESGTEHAGSSDFDIADNLFLRRDDRFRLIGWTVLRWASAGPYGSHSSTSYYAVKVYGPDTSSCTMRSAGSTTASASRPMERRNWTGTAARHRSTSTATTSTCRRRPHRDRRRCPHVRVFNNRGINAAQGGYRLEPVFGGPVHFIGNISYHVPSGVAFKSQRSRRSSSCIISRSSARKQRGICP